MHLILLERFMNIFVWTRVARAQWASAAAALVGAFAVIALASCASSQGKVGSTQVTPTAKGSVVEVILKDYEIVMPESVPSGEVTFNITNAGSHDHNLEIDLKGTKRRLDAALKPGETHALIVPLSPGTYDVLCPMTGHSALGMRRKLTVTGQGGW